jgi:hypothetical protein
MLPGFRFLFAATMLSMSLLIFGLGAAALLRAAHESFASNSSWRAAPEVAFAQRPDTTMPVLAALRVEPAATEKANDQPATAVTAVPADQPASAEPAKNDQVAALRPVETAPAEIARPAELPPPAPLADNAPAEPASPAATAISPAIAPPAAPVEETKITTAALDTTSLKPEPTSIGPAKIAPVKAEPAKSEPVAALAEPAPAPASEALATPQMTAAPLAEPADSPAAMRIATLGGPPVDVGDDTPAIELKNVKLPRARPDQSATRPDQSAIRKRVQARRALHRRRIALRARLLFQQQQANPFGQPQSFPQPAAAPLRR